MDYQNFISSKHTAVSQSGFEPRRLSDSLFEYQRHCVEFALRAGRSAMFLDTGLGKTFCQLEYAREVDRKSTRLNSSHLKLSRMPSSA